MGFFDYFMGMGNNSDTTKEKVNTKNTTQSLAFNEEYNEELSTQAELSGQHIIGNTYISNGVNLENITNMAKLTYNGILAKSGAQEVFAVIGYGNNLRWENTTTYKMQPKDTTAYELIFPINFSGNINIAFKDSSNNWDNNYGTNYSFENNYYQQGSH